MSIVKVLSSIAIGMFVSFSAFGQLSGTITVPNGTYPDLASVLTDLNTQGVGAGGVIINLSSGNPQTAVVGGYQLGSSVLNASTSATNPVVINGNGNTVTAGVGTTTNLDGIFIIKGTDYVTVNGLNLAESAANTTTTTQMEWGFALLKANGTAPLDGCQNVKIQNCSVTLARTNTASVGIYVNNHTATSTSSLAAGAATDANSNNTFSGNTLSNVFSGIYINGYSSSSFYDQDNTVSGNTVQNFAGSAGIAYGILMQYQNNSLIYNNIINNMNGSGVAATSTTYGIYSATGQNATIRKNTVSMTYSATTGSMYMIYCTSGSVGNTVNIDTNTVTPTLLGSSTILYCVYISGSPQFLNYNANQITGLTSASTGTHYICYIPATLQPNGMMNVKDNKILNLTRTATSGGTYNFYFTGSTPTTTPFNFIGNKISGVTYASNSSGLFYSIYDFSGSSPYPVKTFAYDTLTNLSLGTGTFYGMYTYNHGNSPVNSTINNCVISNVTSSSTSFYNYYISSTSINGLDFYQNSLTGITNNSLTGSIYGFYLSGGTTINIYKNNFNNIQSAQTTSGAVYPMYISSGTNVNVYNNMISDIRTPAGGTVSPVYGMYYNGGINVNVYHNTINLNPVSTGVNFGATGVYYSSAITNFDFRNNIVRVNATASGTGFVVALRRSSGSTGVSPANLAPSSNSNIYYTPAGTYSWLYGEGTTNTGMINGYNLTNDPAFNTPCGLYKSFMTPRENSSFSENNLVQTGGTGVFAPSGLSFAKSNAVPTTSPAVTDDYNGTIRPALPDVGALQFTGTINDAASPLINYTALARTTYCINPPTLIATITDASGVNTTSGTAPRVYFKKSTEANVFGGANNNTANGWKWVEATNVGSTFTFNFNYSLLNSAIAANDSIQYFIIAQDQNTIPNVGANVVGFPLGYCPASVNLPAAAGPISATPPTNGYIILSIPAFTVTHQPLGICGNGSTTLTLNPIPSGATVQWQQGNMTTTFVNIAGANGSSYTTPVLSASNNYRAIIQCNGSTIATSTIDTAVVSNPQLLTTIPATRCGTGTVNLVATGSAGTTMTWYGSPTSATPIGTGSPFTTPPISATTTYYVSASVPNAATENTGKPPLPYSTSLPYSEYGVTFDLAATSTIYSTTVYPSGTGTMSIAIKNSTGTIIYWTSPIINISGTGLSTPQVIPINFTLPAGIGYRLVTTGTYTGSPNLNYEYNSANFAFPYTSPSGTLSITSGTYCTTCNYPYYYYFFYNISTSAPCASPRTAVTATVTTPPSISVSSANLPGICTGSSATLNASSGNAGYTYSWAPGSLAGSTVVVTPAATTMYVVTATDNTSGPNAGCVAKDSLKIIVSPQPAAPTITPATSSICLGGQVTLTGNTPTSSGLNILGTGTTVNSTTTYPSPYGNWYGGDHEQYLILASELQAAGIPAGNITSLAFNQSAGYTGAALQSYNVKIAPTTLTAMPSSFQSTNFTNVLSVATYTPPATSGWATLGFGTPFVWDGTSNIIVDVSFLNCSVCNATSSCSTTYTTNGTVYQSSTAFVSTYVVYADGNCTINTFTPVGGNTGSYSQRPNMQFGWTKPLTLNWVNTTGLFKNGTLTTPVTTTDTDKVVYASPAVTTSYTAVTNAQGCLSVPSAAAVVTVNPLPVVTLTPSGSQTICSGSSVTFSVPSGANQTYQWKLNGTAIVGATANSYAATAAGSYSVTVNNTATGCTATSASISVTVNPSPTASISASGGTSFCQGGSVLLSANTGAGLTYQWNLNAANIGGATSSTYLAGAAGTYTVTVTGTNGCSATSNSIVVTVNPLPSATITAGGPLTFCQGGSVLLSAPAVSGNTYQWTQNSVMIIGANASTYTATASGSYKVQVTSSAGCLDSSAAILVTVNPLPVATATAAGPTTFCQGGSVLINAPLGAGLSYQWMDGASPIAGATSSSYTATTTGNYSVVVTNSNGCSAASTAVSVTVNALPVTTITASGPLSFCQGGSVTLSVPLVTGQSYQWRLGAGNIAGATNDSYTATATGSYKVIITNGAGCMDSSTATVVTVNALPTATAAAGGPTTFCQGGSVTLSANTGFGLSYQWKRNGFNIFPGGNGSTYAATTSGSYTVTVTNSNGCQATSTAILVTVNALPSTNVSASGPVTFCIGGQVTLFAATGSGLSYQWRVNSANIAGATASSYTTSTSGTYKVVITNASGCIDSSSGTLVTVNALPLATATALGNTAFCQGGSVTLSANTGAGLSYQWKRNAVNIGGATASTYSATLAGSYTVTVTNSNGCQATSAPIVLTVYALPSTIITPAGPVSVCQNDTTLLSAVTGSGLTYQWQLFGSDIVGATNAVLGAYYAGSYTVTVRNSNGCIATSAPVTVVVNPLPIPLITRNGLVLTTGAFASYQWFLNGQPIAGATSASWTAQQNGVYTVRVTDANGCANSSREITMSSVGVSGVTASAGIRIYPNPTRDLVYVSAATPVSITIFGVDGKRILQVTDSRQVDISSLADGIYTIKVTDQDGHSVIQKLTKATW